MKEMMRATDELRLSRDEAVAAAKESEKKIKAMEADTFHLQEVLNNHQLKQARRWLCLNSGHFTASYLITLPRPDPVHWSS